ncbi:hypothetical protein ACVXHB_28885 [Escherichia coli]
MVVRGLPGAGGADGNCHQPPRESCGKINGAWEMHASPVTLRQCSSFARALAVWNNDAIDETSPILSATLPPGERCQIVVPPAVSVTPSQSPA